LNGILSSFLSFQALFFVKSKKECIFAVQRKYFQDVEIDFQAEEIEFLAREKTFVVKT